MGSSVSKQVEPPKPELNPMDIIDVMTANPPSPKKIAMDAAGGHMDLVIPETLQLIASDPKKYNIASLTKFLKSMTGMGGSRKRSYGRIKKRSNRKIRNDRRSKKLK
jgi:hypothetical protein